MIYLSKERWHLWVRRGGLIASCLILLVVAAGLWLHHQLKGSLPQLDGQAQLTGLSAPITITRDELGIPSIRGSNRLDVARATGYIHAQDRYFQMDLLRRSAAGEMAELFGAKALPLDRKVRLHRFRTLAASAFSTLPDAQQKLLNAYTDGVNAGLAALRKPPFEYLLLRTEPTPWRAQDSLLVLYAMYLTLQDKEADRESAHGVLHDVLPQPLYHFLTPQGTEWDAPLQGPPLNTPPIPAVHTFDLRSNPALLTAANDPTPWQEGADDVMPGSNNWAVAGRYTLHGSALLANDMHLGLNVPNTWYRAVLLFPTSDGRMHSIAGVTLPGAPIIVVGSNGQIAWGFTNAYGDWLDLVILDFTADGRYLTPAGPRSVERFHETIAVRGEEPQDLDIAWTVWGPVLDRDHRGRQRAMRWVAHDPKGVNLEMANLETAANVEEAIAIANRAGAPAQNFVVAGADGRIGWTILGPIPNRVGHDGRLPRSWADGQRGWNGWLDAAAYPRIIDPPAGRLWTANARVVSGADLAKLGNGGYALGARARQIRDRLLVLDPIRETDSLALQLDDRALFLERWRDLLLSVLSPDAVGADPRRQQLRVQVQNWSGHADVEAVGFRMVRAFRQMVAERVFNPLTLPCRQADPNFRYDLIRQQEGPLWQLVSERPAHLLDPHYPDWQKLFLDVVDALLDHFMENGAQLAEHTWGAHNTIHIDHPLGVAIPFLGHWLNLKPVKLPGDRYMPRVQTPFDGASQRLVVAPGQENEGIFHMPAGQSGHPLSPFYRNGHEDWVNGEPSAFLPGPAAHRLILNP